MLSGNGPSPMGSGRAHGDFLGMEREEKLPLPTWLQNWDIRRKIRSPLQRPETFQELFCFQQIKGSGYFRKQMVMIRVLSLK